MGSDYEVILWEIIEGGEKGGQSRVVTGWNISSWSNRGVTACASHLASGMREEGMWSDAEREDGMWRDAERATDILKRSCRPLLSFFSFLMQQLVCPPSRIEASCHNLPLSLSCLGRRRTPLLSLSCLGRRRALSLSLSLSCPRTPAAHRPCPVRYQEPA